MILVDTSVWIDHLRRDEPELALLLHHGDVLAHPWVTGELALSHLSQRNEILGLLHNLPQARAATDVEVLALIDNHHLFGLGIGYVDAHLLAATMLTTGARLWTRDKRLAVVAAQHGIASGDEPTS
ncbi:MAG: type II toxin-antitoxin system VapC family toxin [Humibacillus sp.]|nr:type II toxin-antitoxin system VapC family toxin [Humibacillus sp.]MDN5777019.1 type II toxin-antitoxin system VapC family toxin [Humibacillus sp.]